jgi:cytochrome b6-f complex iron-sulfur subunit
MNPETGPTRRNFLDIVIGLFSAITGAAMTIPGLMYLWPAAKGAAADRVEVEGAASMAPGQSKMVQFGGQAVVVLRDRSGYRAFSAVCTHLGCLVRWDEPRQQFLCPCHAAAFDKNGQVVSGPPPRALPEYVVREIEGRVYVLPA